MEQESTLDSEAPGGLAQRAAEILRELNQYGDVIIESLIMIMGGVVAIYLIHELASKFLLPHFHKGRLIILAGVTFYALILVATALMVLNLLGVDVTVIGQIAFVGVFVVVVFIFFLLPFLPKLPFQIGNLVEIRGELGEVTAISPLFTTLQKFDGTLVFVPNTSIVSATIRNYSHTSSRRIEINLGIRHDSDLERAKAVCVRLMSEDGRVLDVPSPPTVFVIGANEGVIELLAVCWVKNEDWFSTQSDLWEKIVSAFNEDIHLASPDAIPLSNE
ncbi:mechanosensitive ion channel family protein [Pseudomonadota bacterium]